MSLKEENGQVHLNSIYFIWN